MNFDAHGGTDNRNRAIGLLCVVVLHVLLVWGLMNGLARKAVELLPSPIETKIIEEIHPPMEAAPPPTPEIEPPPLPSIPPPEIVIEQPPPPVTQAITQIAPVPQPAPPPPKPAVAQAPETVRVPAKFDKGSCPIPRYPEYAKRQGLEGLSRIKVLVGADGKTIKDVVVTSSSGSDVLDRAAIAAFKRCNFSVEVVDGVPRDTWFPIQYQWTIKDE
jgi:protein TonB